MPGRPTGAEVAQESRVEQGRRTWAVAYLARLPRVQRQGGISVGQGQLRSGEPGGEQPRGYSPAAFGPGGVGGEYGVGDRQPVQREGASRFGRVVADLGFRQALAALRGRVQRMPEQEGLLGGEEAVGSVGGTVPAVAQEEGGATNGVGDTGDEVECGGVAGLGRSPLG